MGRHQNRKLRKFVQIRVEIPPSDLWDISYKFWPPPLWPNWDIFEFQTFSKNADQPPPLWANWDIFEFQTFLIKVILQTTLSNNWYFWKKTDPPLCFQDYQIEIGTFLGGGFTTPPPPYWDIVPNFLDFHTNHHHPLPQTQCQQYLSCYYPIWPNLKDRLLGSSWTDSKCHSDICPCNICSCDICPYQEYISCYWFDFHQTLKVGTWNHIWQTPAVMETGNMCPGDICPYCEYLSCYRPKLF